MKKNKSNEKKIHEEIKAWSKVQGTSRIPKNRMNDKIWQGSLRHKKTK